MRSHNASKLKVRYRESANFFRNFRPSLAVEVLTSTELAPNDYLKTWTLGRLLAWMILDQPRRRRRSKRTGKRRIRRSNANQIGLVVLGVFVDFELKKLRSSEASDKFKQLFGLFLVCDGFAGLQNRGGRAILSRMKEKDRELQCVIRIVDYMCRFASQHAESDANFSIESAKKFVEKYYDEEQMGPSKISKIWEKYKYASPYIFGASALVEQVKAISTIDDFLAALRQVTDGEMKFIMSKAAYAADIIGRKARDIPRWHFRGVEPSPPLLNPFTQEEVAIICSIDRNAPIP